jgi:hypothetical protein
VSGCAISIDQTRKASADWAITLTKKQTRVLERFSPEFRERHIEASHTGALVAVGAFLCWRRE